MWSDLGDDVVQLIVNACDAPSAAYLARTNKTLNAVVTPVIKKTHTTNAFRIIFKAARINAGFANSEKRRLDDKTQMVFRIDGHMKLRLVAKNRLVVKGKGRKRTPRGH